MPPKGNVERYHAICKLWNKGKTGGEIVTALKSKYPGINDQIVRNQVGKGRRDGLIEGVRPKGNRVYHRRTVPAATVPAAKSDARTGLKTPTAKKRKRSADARTRKVSTVRENADGSLEFRHNIWLPEDESLALRLWMHKTRRPMQDIIAEAIRVYMKHRHDGKKKSS